jgi:hypothetical protein
MFSRFVLPFFFSSFPSFLPLVFYPILSPASHLGAHLMLYTASYFSLFFFLPLVFFPVHSPSSHLGTHSMLCNVYFSSTFSFLFLFLPSHLSSASHLGPASFFSLPPFSPPLFSLSLFFCLVLSLASHSGLFFSAPFLFPCTSLPPCICPCLHSFLYTSLPPFYTCFFFNPSSFLLPSSFPIFYFLC